MQFALVASRFELTLAHFAMSVDAPEQQDVFPLQVGHSQAQEPIRNELEALFVDTDGIVPFQGSLPGQSSGLQVLGRPLPDSSLGCALIWPAQACQFTSGVYAASASHSGSHVCIPILCGLDKLIPDAVARASKLHVVDRL